MRLGSTVPNFKAETTKGPISFYDWKGGSWVVLFSHPGDFTPVCTTELGRMAVYAAEFAKRNTKCLAHSVDHLKSHDDWVKDIKSYCLDITGDFPYPIIADPNRDLAIQFDMLDEDQRKDPEAGQTVRALFIIDPAHKLRLSMYYPMSCGRNIDEILRTIDSLQLSDRLRVIATPANWTPGCKVMIIPQVSDNEAKKIFPKGFDKVKMPSGANYFRITDHYKDL